MRIVIVVNPAARSFPGRRGLARPIDAARSRGWDAELACTRGPGDATCIAADAARSGADAVFAWGGDGTLNEVANGLAGTDVALGFIPAGTVNIWAIEHRIPRDPARALALLAEGAVRRVDLGWAEWPGGRRAFLLMAGIGYDGVLTRAVDERTKRLFGPLAFVRAMASTARYRPPLALVRTPAVTREVRLAQLVASNTRRYAGIVQPAPRALADDGLLDIGVLDIPRLLPDVLAAAPHLLAGIEGGRGTWRVRAAEALIEPARAVPLQVDGEVVGEGPVRLTVERRAMRIVVPRGPNALYRGAEEPAVVDLAPLPGLTR